MFEMIRDLWEDGWPGRSVLGIILLMLALIPLLIWAMIEDEKQWSAFRIEHHCVIVGRMSGDTFVGTGIGSNGQLTTTIGTTSSKTGWKCNDGVTYWR